ncbi:MAG: GGDEF domain-containing protein [Acidimicrobiales bacterium]
MRPAPFAPDETGRLIALRDLQLVDTPPERRFDRVAQLAARLTGTPIGVVSLVEETRVFFKSVCGLADSRSVLGEPHRSYWFCAHVVATGIPLVVADAREDDRFDRLPAVTAAPAGLSYAGVPLRAPRGEHVGALAVLAMEARPYSSTEIKALVELAKLVESEFSSLPHGALDTLTGALNARTFIRLGDRFLELAASRGEPATVLRIKLREVAAINSQFGLEMGDAALIETARLLGSSVRGSDLVGRIGPDEFAVLLYGAPSEAAKVVVERLKASAEARNALGDQKYDLSFQIGLSEHQPGHHSTLADELLTAGLVADLGL